MAIDNSLPILVVDDYRTMIRIIRNLLRQLGLESVEEATDGAGALEMLRDRRFGLVIADWNMAPMSGLELLKEIRADAAIKDLPFIMVTAESRTEAVVAAQDAGVSNTIVKPFNAATLRAKLVGVLGDF